MNFRFIKLIFILTIVSILFASCKKNEELSDAQSELFVKYYGSSGIDGATDLKQTSDGGYIMTGYINLPNKGKDLLVIKTDKNGNTEWQKEYGDTLDDTGNSIQITSDGGYVVLGTIVYDEANSDMFLLKFDGLGNEIWNKKLGSPYVEEGHDLKITSDGGFILVGYTSQQNIIHNNPLGENDFYAVKTNSTGEVEWSKAYGSPDDDYATSVIEKADGGYVIIGSSNKTPEPGQGGYSILLVETNEIGNSIDTYTYGAEGNEFGEEVIALSDGYAIIGTSSSSSGNGGADVYVAKIGVSVDNVVWEQRIGGEQNETGNSIQTTSDNGFIIAASTESEGSGLKDQYLVKLSPDGATEWTNTFGGLGNDNSVCAIESSDSRFVLLGSTELENNQMITLIKTNSEGKITSK